jgi:hypothetical protein
MTTPNADLATKADLEQLRLATKEDVARLEAQLEVRIDRLEVRIEALDKRLAVIQWIGVIFLALNGSLIGTLLWILAKVAAR